MTAIVEESVAARPRSVVPGRQRWELRLLRGRPDVAAFLEARLLASPGVGDVRANPVTGRLLVFHDQSVSSADLGHRIREAATVVAVQGSVPLLPPSKTAAPLRGVTPLPGRRGSLLIPLAGGVAAVALGGVFLWSPGAKLAAVLGATALILRRAWRRSTRSVAATTPTGKRRPLRTVVGSHRRLFRLATTLSAAGAVLYMAAAACAFSLASVLIAGSSVTFASLGIATLSGQVSFLGAAGVAFCILFAVAWFIGGVMWRDLAQKVQHDWRCTVYAHVQRAQLGFLEGERTTAVARVLTADIDQFGRFLANQANYLVRVMTTLGLLVFVFLVFAPGIAWLALLPVPIVAWLSIYYQERVAPDLAMTTGAGSRLSGQLINNLEASATIKSFGAEDFEVDRIRRLSEAYGMSSRVVDYQTTAYGQAVLGLSMIGLVAVYVFGGHLVLAGVLLIGAYNTVIRLPQLLNFQLPGLGEAVEGYQRMAAALERVLRLLDLPVEPSSTGRGFDWTAVEGEIVLESVTFGYPSRPALLQDLTLRIEARKTTAIVGATGVGKSTIAKLLLRFQEVDSGRVLLDGVDIRELRLHDLRAAIGFVGQEAFLFDGTVGDNITYGSFDADPERVVAAARLAEADAFVAALPLGYETKVGERGATLSGGQRQRISLARAIVKNAPILVLDEATSAVDNETEAAIQHALAGFARGRTMVVIAHRLSTIRHADRIYVMGEGGVLVEQGRHAELLDNDGLYARLWRLQIGEATQ